MSTDAQSTLVSLRSRPQTMVRFVRHWSVAFAAATIFVVCGHSLIKAGLNAAASGSVGMTLVPRILHLLSQPFVIEGLLIYFLGTVCWMVAVAQKEISFLYPLTSINYVLVTAMSTALFREVISPRRALGVLVIVLGMLLMNRKRARTESQ